VPDVADAAGDSDMEVAEMARLAALLPADETQLLYSLCLHGRAELGLAPDEYAALTMVLLRLLAFKPQASSAGAEKKTLKTPEPAAAPARVVAAAQPPARPAQTALPAPEPQTRPASATAPVATEPAAPQGRVLPVLDNPKTPAGNKSSQAPAPADQAQPAGKVVAVPVRLQTETRADAAVAGQASGTPLVPTEEGAFWHLTVQQLIASEAVTALVRELALQSQLVARDTDQWLLRVERESLNSPTSRERLQAALQAAGHPVTLGVEIGRVSDSPAKRNGAAAAERQLAAEKIIFEDPFVQSMMRDFGAKIVPGSIKPI
jgi:DNA polymerase-3 subunit gamma/tau